MSTQNGFNLFYKIWQGAITKKNIYAPFKVDWYQVPQFNTKTKKWEKRTEKWKETMVGILGSEEAFQYQYGTSFSASDSCILSRESMSAFREKAILYEPISNEQEYNNLNKKDFYIKADYPISNFKKKHYIILVDLAEGGGGDYTVFNILEIVGKDTRAWALMKGIVVLFIVWLIAVILGMNVLLWIFQNAMVIGITAIVIIFQPEFRNALEQLGRKSFSSIGSFDDSKSKTYYYLPL